MQSVNGTIKVARIAEGWAWALIDGRGETSASGRASEQTAAMEAAWLTARQGQGGFPEIVVEHGRIHAYPVDTCDGHM